MAAALPAMGPDAHATFPGDNGDIAFAKDGNIVRQDPCVTAAPTELTTTGLDSDPSFSHDGQQLAFVRAIDPDAGDFDVMRMPSDDGDPETNVTNHPAFDDFPSWSADSSRIAFDTDRDGNFEIYTIDPDGTGPQRLTEHEADDFDPRWSPDGNKIAFTSDRDGEDLDILSMNADGSGVTPLTSNTVNDFSPSWSPDATKIAFVRSDLIADRSDPTDENIWVMNADGSNLVRLMSTPNTDEIEPSWSPDGKQIAFLRQDGGEFGAYTMPAGGGSPTKVADDVDALGLDWQAVDAPVPPSTTSVIPEGATHSGFTTFLLLSNPDPDTCAVVDVTALTPAGAQAPASLQGIRVSPRSRKTVNLNTALATATDVATRIVSHHTPVVAEVSVQRAGSLAAMNMSAAEEAAAEWVIPEGASHSGFATFVTVANPSGTDTHVDVEFLPKQGDPIEGPQNLEIPANGRVTINAGKECECADDISTVIRANLLEPGVVAGLSLHKVNPLPGSVRNDLGIGGSLGLASTADTWVLAEGATHSGWATFVLVANPTDSDATVDLTFLRKSGGPVEKDGVAVPAGQRVTLNVGKECACTDDVSTLVDATSGAVAVESTIQRITSDGFIIGDSTGSSGASVTAAAGTQWLASEGATHSGFATFILVANPDTENDAVIDVSFLTKSQGVVTPPALQNHTIEPGQRFTILVNRHVTNDDVSTLVQADSGAVVVEVAIDRITGQGYLKGRTAAAKLA